jgi:large subunit ribosomal protein L31
MLGGIAKPNVCNALVLCITVRLFFAFFGGTKVVTLLFIVVCVPPKAWDKPGTSWDKPSVVIMITVFVDRHGQREYYNGLSLWKRICAMKQEIHPKYNEIEVTCACGNTFKTRSTGGDLHIEICSECHPFFTGKQKLVDTAGRVDRFNKRYQRSGAAAK